MDVYRQRTLLGGSSYRIVEDGVIVESKRLTQRRKQLVPFNSLEYSPEIVSSSSRWAFWSAVACALLAMVLMVDYFTSPKAEAGAVLFYLVGAVLFGAIYVASRNAQLVFYSEHHRLDFRYLPDDPDRDAFIERMKRAKLDYFRNKLSDQKSVFDPIEQQRYVAGLQDAGVLDQEAVLELNSLLKVEPKPQIGFSNE